MGLRPWQGGNSLTASGELHTEDMRTPMSQGVCWFPKGYGLRGQAALPERPVVSVQEDGRCSKHSLWVDISFYRTPQHLPSECHHPAVLISPSVLSSL